MIKIQFTQKNSKLSLTVVGHSDYRKKGEDILCAAVSVLTATLAIYLEKHSSNSICRLGNGYAEICSHNKSDEDFYNIICEGLKKISEYYPDNVEFSEFN